jgi:hypothetical protein
MDLVHPPQYPQSPRPTMRSGTLRVHISTCPLLATIPYHIPTGVAWHGLADMFQFQTSLHLGAEVGRAKCPSAEDMVCCSSFTRSGQGPDPTLSLLLNVAVT